MVFGKMWAMEWSCPACGCQANDATIRNCDECLLKFYFDNPNASSFADWREPNKSAMTDESWSQTAQLAEQAGYTDGFKAGRETFSKILMEQFELFSKGFDAGADDVLTALAEFCHQGGSINAENVIAWVKTYELKSEKGE